MSSKVATNGKAKAPRAAAIRCAIYTRKSTNEGLDQDFNSLDNQRERAEDYIRSQREMGWIALEHRYDDGGVSGALAERPALNRLLADIEAGKIDRVVVYKTDRLFRHVFHLGELLHRMEAHDVSLVSVTEPFDTSTPAGRFMLHILASSAQMERELIAERTRDKIHAARKRGKWTGGPPPLGYDIAPQGGRIFVNEVEAKLVRDIFGLHAEHETVTRTVEALNERGWKTKAWTTRDGRVRPGGPWTKHTLGKLLANPTYIGRVGLKGEDFEGEHPGIVKPEVFANAQELLARATHKPGRRRGGRRGTALLSGLLRCAPCNAAMGMTWTRRGTRVHHYYLCRRTQKEGWSACPHPSVRAHDIESLVVEQIRVIGRDSALQERVLEAVREQGADVDPADLRRALTIFDPVWEALHSEEKARIMRLLIEGIDYDGAAGTAVVAFRATGIQGLAEELAP